jgi:hypothetical protein
MAKTIEVIANPMDVPQYLASNHELWFGNLLRSAGVPLSERSLKEGPRRGRLERQTLEGGSVLFRWTDEEGRQWLA